MKKFYLLIFTLGFLLTSFVSYSQITVFSTIPNDGINHDLTELSIWNPPGIPPAHCTMCDIRINCDVTMTTLSVDIQLINSTITISAGNTFSVNNYLQLFNSMVVVGSDATTFATVFVNDQVDLNGTSTVQLGNINTSIDANNNALNPVNGPHLDYIGVKSAGIYYITLSDGHGFTQTLNAIGSGSSAPGGGFAQYNLNCEPAVSGAPNNCAPGIVYGPATTTIDALSGLIFTQSLPLPVILVQFLATKNDDATVKLSWATSQEINSASFDIERSADQGSWEKIGAVAAKGYSSTTANYSFTDQAPLTGNGYYRLKMIDRDGKFKYSKVVAVTSDKDSRPLVVYSNPFSDQIRLKVNVNRAQNLSLTVSDIIGKTYLKQSYNAQAGDNLINLVPPVGTARGMYILHIQGNAFEQTVKLARQ